MRSRALRLLRSSRGLSQGSRQVDRCKLHTLLPRPLTGPLTRVVITIALAIVPALVSAQELEPGAYWPIPRGLNILTTVVGTNWGDVTFDPALPVDDGSARIGSLAFAYARAFGIGGRSANASVALPIMRGRVRGIYLGERAEVSRFGLGDPKLKLAINLYGAPSMAPVEFAKYRQRWLVGVSLTVAPPLGEYNPAVFINLGSNRWSFKPEIGVSRTRGSWILEAMAGVWLFTDNTNFAGGRTREQDPVVITQVHLTRRFTPGMWLAADANFFTGGRTTVNGTANLDLQRNSRIGFTFSKALRRNHAIRASVSRGAYTTIGADFTSIAVGYNYAWAR